jgi:acyl carrier protein
MTCDLSQVVGIVDDFVARTRGVPAKSVEPATRLLQEGLLDSFSLVELMGEIESALGSRIPEGALIPEDFETPTLLFKRLQSL